jgi:hypothetical protein
LDQLERKTRHEYRIPILLVSCAVYLDPKHWSTSATKNIIHISNT